MEDVDILMEALALLTLILMCAHHIILAKSIGPYIHLLVPNINEEDVEAQSTAVQFDGYDFKGNVQIEENLEKEGRLLVGGLRKRRFRGVESEVWSNWV